MDCAFRFIRSDEWVAAERLRTGENVDEHAIVVVAVASLSEASRALLLAGQHGSYPADLQYVRVDCGTLDVCAYSRDEIRGLGKLRHNGATPTPADVDAMLAAAVIEARADAREIIARRVERERKEAEREAEKERKEAEREAARELLADELAEGKLLGERLRTVADFLSHVPQDALRGTVRTMAEKNSDVRAEEIQGAVETASPVWIFSDGDDDDED